MSNKILVLGKIFVAAAMVFLGVLAGLPAAHASDCLDSPDDVVAGVLSGSLSVAACQTRELIDTIRSLISTVTGLIAQIRKSANEIANAAADIVRARADQNRMLLGIAQRDLRNASTQGRQIATNLTPDAQSAGGSGSSSSATGLGAQLDRGISRVSQNADRGADALSRAVSQKIGIALNRASQRIDVLESGVQNEVVARIQSGLQRALDQARANLASAVSSATIPLLQPLRLTLDTLNDIIAHPERLIDPSVEINRQVAIVRNNVAGSLDRIEDAITRDALATLRGVEADIRRAENDTAFARRIVAAMARATRERSQAALDDLESLLGGTGGTDLSRGPGVSRNALSPSATSTGGIPIRATLDAVKAQAGASVQHQAIALSQQGATVRALQTVPPPGLDANTRRQGEDELDKMFKGKSPTEVERAKSVFLARVRQRYANEPRLVATIEQSIHAEAAKRVAVSGVARQPAASVHTEDEPYIGGGRGRAVPRRPNPMGRGGIGKAGYQKSGDLP